MNGGNEIDDTAADRVIASCAAARGVMVQKSQQRWQVSLPGAWCEPTQSSTAGLSCSMPSIASTISWAPKPATSAAVGNIMAVAAMPLTGSRTVKRIRSQRRKSFK